MVSDVSDLYAWQTALCFNPKALRAIEVEEGDFLKCSNTSTLWIPGEVDNYHGIIYLSGCSLTGQSEGVNGHGELMRVIFDIISSEDFSLRPRRSQIIGFFFKSNTF